MKGIAPTKRERAFWTLLSEIVGCIACRKDGRRNHFVSIHHVDGRTQPDCHWNVLPLCAGHHQDNGQGLIAVHPWKARFEAKYGDQQSLRQECNVILERYMNQEGGTRYVQFYGDPVPEVFQTRQSLALTAGPTAALTQEQQDGSKETSSEGQANARAGEIDPFDVEAKGRQKGSAKAEEKARPQQSGRQGATFAGSAEPDADGKHARSSSRTGDAREQHGQRRRVKL